MKAEPAVEASSRSWRWEQGEQPAFSPRRAAVPTGALDRLRNAGTQVVLGWFHRYPARFAADVVTGMLADVIINARRPVHTVLDPFYGTGATVDAARQLGVAAIGLELTPLGVAIRQLRLDPPADPWDAAALCERISRIGPAARPGLDDKLTEWLGTENARLLTAWMSALNEIGDTRLRRFATVALSQSLRPSSR